MENSEGALGRTSEKFLGQIPREILLRNTLEQLQNRDIADGIHGRIFGGTLEEFLEKFLEQFLEEPVEKFLEKNGFCLGLGEIFVVKFPKRNFLRNP